VVTDADMKRAIAALTGTAVTLDVAKPLLPKSSGVYAWWIAGAVIPNVPVNKHPFEVDLDLAYVGIAANRPGSSATLRSRVVGNHMNGNIAASTLRRILAALLIATLDLQPTKKGKKVVLPKDQNLRLSGWQMTHLRVTWFATAAPWLVESAINSTLKPPLNLDGNETHPFYKDLSAARRALNLSAH
jgi:hypothetical protein